MSKVEITVAVSGGFDPVHIAHLRMFQEAKKLGDRLVVIINGDSWLVRKKGKYLMTQADRAEIVKGFSCVDEVYIHESDDVDVCGALAEISPDIFVNGGDRKADNIPEYAFCDESGIKMVFNVGPSKIRSSSEMLDQYNGRTL